MRVRVYRTGKGRFDVLCEFKRRTRLVPVMTKGVTAGTAGAVLLPLAANETRVKEAIRAAKEAPPLP